MSVEGLKKINELYFKEGGVFEENNRMNIIDYFMKTTIETFKEQQKQIVELKGKVKNLEQAKTHFPMTEDKHRALLNNCVDDDEAILRKREIEGIEEAKSDG